MKIGFLEIKVNENTKEKFKEKFIVSGLILSIISIIACVVFAILMAGFTQLMIAGIGYMFIELIVNSSKILEITKSEMAIFGCLFVAFSIFQYYVGRWIVGVTKAIYKSIKDFKGLKEK